MGKQNPDDIIICYSKRTALTTAMRKGFKDTFAEIMLKGLFEDLFNTLPIKPEIVGDIIVGNVL